MALQSAAVKKTKIVSEAFRKDVFISLYLLPMYLGPEFCVSYLFLASCVFWKSKTEPLVIYLFVIHLCTVGLLIYVLKLA